MPFELNPRLMQHTAVNLDRHESNFTHSGYPQIQKPSLLISTPSCTLGLTAFSPETKAELRAAIAACIPLSPPTGTDGVLHVGYNHSLALGGGIVCSSRVETSIVSAGMDKPLTHVGNH